MLPPSLIIDNLKTYYETRSGAVRAVDGVSFQIEVGEAFGLAGESGCGKTTIALSIMRLLPRNGRIVNGKILFKGLDLTEATLREMNKIRWKRISMIFQGAMNALNPVHKVGDQIVEAIVAHDGVEKREALERAGKLMEMVGLSTDMINKYPHELSGGMKQRVIIAMALSCNPELIIADEPTTALDVIVQAQILKLIGELKAKLNLSLMLITHDLSIISELCNRVAIMYAGKIVEIGDVKNVCRSPLHPYTQGLVAAFPSVREEKRKLSYIPGSPPDLLNPPSGCRFHLRCSKAMDKCRMEEPKLAKVNNTFIACHLYD
ncbi:MAG: ABC transporter ATP-binding protein [Candidatus Methanomethylicia archaeon]